MRRTLGLIAALLLCLPGMSEAQSCDGCGIGYIPSSVSSANPAISGNTTLGIIVEPSAPTVAVNATAGNLNGNYYYRVTFVTATAETTSCVSCYSLVVAPANQQVNLSAIPVSSDARVVARNIYRTAAAGSYFTDMKLVATISNNTATTLTDNVADAARGVYMPWANTTGAKIYRNADIMLGADETYTVFGYKAMSTSLGYDNFAIGPYALGANTYGHDLGAIGPDALASNTTGNYNMAMGESALYKNTTGSNNSGFGMNALRHNTTGDNNVAMGLDALRGATSAGSEYIGNTAVGSSALRGITTGASNAAIGSQAGFSNSSGNFNVSVGHNANYTASTTSGNTAIGEGALALSSGTQNTAFGYRAGYHETGSYKIFIDNRDRTNEAGERSLSLIYGVTGAAAKDQTATINAFLALAGIAYADLGTPANGTFAYCSDCAKATPCAGSGSGALAKRLNGAWDCD